MITSRVTSMALFALQFNYYIFPAVVSHWALMTMWLISQNTEFCQTKAEERFFCGVIAVVHIFCFFNMKEGRTRLRIATYYIIVFFENSAMAVLWYYYSGMYIRLNYGILALSFVWAGFFIGIITMTIYYGCFHPNNYKSFQSSEGESSLSQTSGYGTDTGTDTLEGVYYQDVPDGVFLSNKLDNRHIGNMFTKSGRRYLYWLDISGKDTEDGALIAQKSRTEDEKRNVTDREDDNSKKEVYGTVFEDEQNMNWKHLPEPVWHETSV